MKIAFYSNQLGYRGTDKNLKYLAKFNQTVLNNESIIITVNTGSHTALETFKDYETHIIDNNQFNYICEKTKVDYFYAIKPGYIDYSVVDVCKQLNHFVYTEGWEFHGHRCAFISDYLVDKANKAFFSSTDEEFQSKQNFFPLKKYEWSLPFYCKEYNSTEENLKQYLSIPKDKIVLGYMGGSDQFSIDWVRDILIKYCFENNDVYFIFLGVDPWFIPSSCSEYFKFLPFSVEEDFICKFINTCDGMIHARADGETFGLSIAEFSLKNKPVLTYNTFSDDSHPLEYNKYMDTAHLDLLKEKGWYYRTPSELYFIIKNFKDIKEQRKNINYRENYQLFNSPEYIMKRFSEIYLS